MFDSAVGKLLHVRMFLSLEKGNKALRESPGWWGRVTGEPVLPF